MRKHKVLICGGGFGGVKAALKLEKDSHFDVTLISDHSDFRYYPTLFRTATGGKRMISSIPLNEIFPDRDVNVVIDSIESMNRAAKTVTSAKGHSYKYDTLVLGLGVKTNYFGIEGLEKFSYGIKTIEEAEELKSHLHQQLCDEAKPDLNYIVVGGGPTGIELAGTLPGYLKKVCRGHGLKNRKFSVSLVEAAPRLLPRMPKDLSRSITRHLRRIGVKVQTGSKVEAETVDGLMVNGHLIKSHTVIWTAGVAAHPFFAEQNFQAIKNGKVRVDQFLLAEPDIYVIGDNADTPYSGMAQTALHDGRYVAENLIRRVRGEEPVPYQAKKPVFVFPAGEYWAGVLWGRWRLYGVVGWMLRRAADLIGYRDYEPWHKAGKRWLAEDDWEDDCPQCSLG